MARILLTGGSGRLGTAIRQIVECIAPSHEELDVLDYWQCCQWVKRYPVTVIHCAGFVNAAEAETHHFDCWTTNVIGTEYMLNAAKLYQRPFVYISTDYIFDGKKGTYSENDTPNPINFYGKTKLAAEMAVRQYDGTLILRAPFRADPPWRFDRAFVDQWTSCDFVSVRAPQIVQAALSGMTGTLHIGGPRRTIWEMANEATPGVGKMTRAEVDVPLPRDTSLDCSTWRSLFPQ